MRVRSNYVFIYGTASTFVFLGKRCNYASSFARIKETKYRALIQQYLRHVEPDQVAARIRNRIVRRTFYAAGVNHFWAMDQHDKWKRFGLFWHGCIEAFTGKILWLVVWWNNSNPKFVCAQYLKAIRSFGGMFCYFSSLLCL